MIPRALTIAGSDASGGAGVQADLKTFTVFRVYGTSALTALTAQNTTGVSAIVTMAPEFVRAQIDAVLDDIGADAAKTGMLANRAIVDVVADAVRARGIEQLVVDPVMVAQSGAALLDPGARRALLERLIPLARVVTPNAPEAAALLDMAVDTVDDLREAARRLVACGARAALVKGGHLGGTESVDILYDGSEVHTLRAQRVDTPHTHGTGCMLSAAIAAGLAQRRTLLDAVRTAKQFVTVAVRAGLAIGGGSGPANALAWLERE